MKTTREIEQEVWKEVAQVYYESKDLGDFEFYLYEKTGIDSNGVAEKRT